jgi:hypothetical protein
MHVFIMKFAPGLHTSQYLGHFENNTHTLTCLLCHWSDLFLFDAFDRKKVRSVTRHNEAKRSLITQDPHEVKVYNKI